MEYRYAGTFRGRTYTLARSAAAELAARQWMQRLPALSEGKMLGVLVLQGGALLYAYSGSGGPPFPGQEWVPPLPQRSLAPVKLEQLEHFKEQIQALSARPELRAWEELQSCWQRRWQTLQQRHALQRQQRQHWRGQLADAELDRLARLDSLERRSFRRQRKAELEPLGAEVASIRSRLEMLRQERRRLSRRLQESLHDPWRALFPGMPPTGIGECCAPKLLYHAARLGLQPTGLAEFWWGPPGAERQPGQFYPACSERCQPILGALLAPFHRPQTVYEDEHLLVIDKPTALLSVPGRSGENSVATYFPQMLPVHRLDRDTSGLLLLARSPQAQRQLQNLFAHRQVIKCYQALLEMEPQLHQGSIELPLGRDPQRPGCYRAHPDGKPARTWFRKLGERRFEFRPETGRSHQIRVHSAAGLASPILGDPLYGQSPAVRLMLHACGLEFTHPVTGQTCAFWSDAPF